MRITRLRPSRLVVAAILAVGSCGRNDDAASSRDGGGSDRINLSAKQVDPVALDMFAPVSGASLRNGRSLRQAIQRAEHAGISTCLRKSGFEDLGDFVPDNARSFAFPDLEDLRTNGFRQSLPAAENFGKTLPNTPEFLAAYHECDKQNVVGWDMELESWAAEVEASLERPEEQRLWQSAADCLKDKVYDPSSLETEQRFAASVTGLVFDIKDLGERLKREQQIARDYIECASPVWKARTADLEARRTDWLEIHREQLLGAQAAINRYLADPARS